MIIGITGVSSIGKTLVAYELQRLLGGTVMCADLFQNHNQLPLSTGQAESREYTSPKFLYGCSTKPIQRESFGRLLECAEKELDNPIILDGLGVYYMPVVLSAGAIVYGLEFDNDLLEPLFANRLDYAIELGIVDEIKNCTDYKLRKLNFVTEFISRHLDGKYSLKDAKTLIVEYALVMSRGKTRELKEFGEKIKWLNHDPNKAKETALIIYKEVKDIA